MDEGKIPGWESSCEENNPRPTGGTTPVIMPHEVLSHRQIRGAEQTDLMDRGDGLTYELKVATRRDHR